MLPVQIVLCVLLAVSRQNLASFPQHSRHHTADAEKQISGMGNSHSTDAIEPNDTRSMYNTLETRQPTAGPSIVVDPQSAPVPAPGALPGSKVPSYFGLMSCATIDVIPHQRQHHQRLLPGNNSAAGAFDSPIASVTDVWLIAGQSNASGDNGEDGQDPPLMSQPLPDFMSIFPPEGRWTALTVPGTHLRVHGFDDARSIGPDIAFARALLALGCSNAVGLVPTAQGGSDLHTKWAPGGSHYSYSVSQAKAAMAALPGARLRGIIWVQVRAHRVHIILTHMLRRWHLNQEC